MHLTTRRRTFAALSGLSVAVTLAACGSNADAASDDTDTDTNTSTSTESDTGSTDTSTDTSTDSDTSTGEYTDGSYTAEGSYSSPGGEESIQVELTIADGVVTEVTVTPEATSGNAARFQEEFASGIADEVVGEELSGLSVDKVSGSSLTGDGFNAALDQIRADATA